MRTEGKNIKKGEKCIYGKNRFLCLVFILYIFTFYYFFFCIFILFCAFYLLMIILGKKRQGKGIFYIEDAVRNTILK